jgi:hypothetical protein
MSRPIRQGLGRFRQSNIGIAARFGTAAEALRDQDTLQFIWPFFNGVEW